MFNSQKTALTLFAGLALGLTSTSAFALSVGDTLGTTEDAVRAALEAQGAVIEELETEDGMIEAEFTLNGKEMEVEIDPSNGAIAEIEAEEDEDDDDDNEEDKDDS